MNSPEGRLKLLITALSDITDDSLLDDFTVSVTLLEKQPIPLGPGSVSCWYHSQCGYRPPGPIGRGSPPRPPHGYHMAVSSCWLLLPAPSEGPRLLVTAPPWASFTPTPPFSVPMRPASAPAGRRATDMQVAEWPQLFHCLSFQFSCSLCCLSWLPGSRSSSDFSSPCETAMILLCWFKWDLFTSHHQAVNMQNKLLNFWLPSCTLVSNFAAKPLPVTQSRIGGVEPKWTATRHYAAPHLPLWSTAPTWTPHRWAWTLFQLFPCRMRQENFASLLLFFLSPPSLGPSMAAEFSKEYQQALPSH